MLPHHGQAAKGIVNAAAVAGVHGVEVLHDGGVLQHRHPCAPLRSHARLLCERSWCGRRCISQTMISNCGTTIQQTSPLVPAEHSAYRLTCVSCISGVLPTICGFMAPSFICFCRGEWRQASETLLRKTLQRRFRAIQLNRERSPAVYSP